MFREAQGALGEDPHGYRAEFLQLVRRAQGIVRPLSAGAPATSGPAMQTRDVGKQSAFCMDGGSGGSADAAPPLADQIVDFDHEFDFSTVRTFAFRNTTMGIDRPENSNPSSCRGSPIRCARR